MLMCIDLYFSLTPTSLNCVFHSLHVIARRTGTYFWGGIRCNGTVLNFVLSQWRYAAAALLYVRLISSRDAFLKLKIHQNLSSDRAPFWILLGELTTLTQTPCRLGKISHCPFSLLHLDSGIDIFGFRFLRLEAWPTLLAEDLYIRPMEKKKNNNKKKKKTGKPRLFYE